MSGHWQVTHRLMLAWKVKTGENVSIIEESSSLQCIILNLHYVFLFGTGAKILKAPSRILCEFWHFFVFHLFKFKKNQLQLVKVDFMISCLIAYLVREPGGSRGNFLLKLWDLSSDVYYMLPNRKKTCWHFGNLPEAKWQPFLKWPLFSLCSFRKRIRVARFSHLKFLFRCFITFWFSIWP